ncbi:MAG: TetR-like C-terminal domain-containing protein, partial [Chloroflexota bacterium]
VRVHVETMRREVNKHALPNPAFHIYDKYEFSFVSGGLYMLIKDWVGSGLRESPETMAKITLVLLGGGFNPFEVQAVVEGNASQDAPNDSLPLLVIRLENNQ